MSFGVLVSTLQDDIQEQDHPVVFISLHPWTRRISAGKIYSEKDHSTSIFDHDNIQLGGRASPMYLAKYFFPFVILKFALHLL